MEAALRIGRKDIPASLAVSSLFRGFKPEAEKRIRVPEVKMDAKLEKIIQAWRLAGYESSIEAYISVAESLLNGNEWTAKDVSSFSIFMERFQDEPRFSTRAGSFLTALMGISPDSEFEIFTQHLRALPSNLGFESKKRFIVHGDIGGNLGFRLMGGHVTVHGNASHNCGERMHVGDIVIHGNSGMLLGTSMTGGNITVEGDAGHLAGAYMKKYYVNTYPAILIKGNAGRKIGDNMNGGEIRIEGGYESLGDVASGKIYQKDRLVVDK